MKCSSNRCRPSAFQEIDRGLGELMRGVLASDTVSSDDPRLSVLEFDNRYVVECDLPGVRLEDIALEIEDKTLSIAGKRETVNDADGAKVVFNERTAAQFARKIRLTNDVDRAAVDAELSNGVLRVTIPKHSNVLPRKVEIKRPQ